MQDLQGLCKEFRQIVIVVGSDKRLSRLSVTTSLMPVKGYVVVPRLPGNHKYPPHTVVWVERSDTHKLWNLFN